MLIEVFLLANQRVPERLGYKKSPDWIQSGLLECAQQGSNLQPSDS